MKVLHVVLKTIPSFGSGEELFVLSWFVHQPTPSVGATRRL